MRRQQARPRGQRPRDDGHRGHAQVQGPHQGPRRALGSGPQGLVRGGVHRGPRGQARFQGHPAHRRRAAGRRRGGGRCRGASGAGAGRGKGRGHRAGRQRPRRRPPPAPPAQARGARAGRDLQGARPAPGPRGQVHPVPRRLLPAGQVPHAAGRGALGGRHERGHRGGRPRRRRRSRAGLAQAHRGCGGRLCGDGRFRVST
mmetsp:Transcript_10297/g.35017  ORF Transcript_10297/g.35017 Transcript_10297/m.35017 type:complete len:201 (-) Transcript_10297:309-911(-)